MGSFSLPHILILLVIVLLLFGAGKIPNVMGDFAKGIKAFKKGLRDEEAPMEPSPGTPAAPKSVDAQTHVGESVQNERKVS